MRLSTQRPTIAIEIDQRIAISRVSRGVQVPEALSREAVSWEAFGPANENISRVVDNGARDRLD